MPEVAKTSFGRVRATRCAMRPISRAANPFSRRNSVLRGGSCRKNSLVKRTAPSGKLTVSRMCPRLEIVSSQLPPPRSIISIGEAVARSEETNPKWISRASSSPEMISNFQPVAERTHSRNARELRASRKALVPTTRTTSAPAFCTARWKRRSTFTVSAMASGESSPVRNTHSPNRVTSRSSWISCSRRPVSRAIFNRTELDPISTAAKVGIGKPDSVPRGVRPREMVRGCLSPV